jgi:hypothetical protein
MTSKLEFRDRAIKAMGAAYGERVAKGNWEFNDLMIAAFDALHGEFTVNARGVTPDEGIPVFGKGEGEIFLAMAATGDLTMPPEIKT